MERGIFGLEGNRLADLIDFQRHGIPETMYERYGRGKFVSVAIKGVSDKRFNKKDKAEKCDIVNAKTSLMLKPEGVYHLNMKGKVVNITFDVEKEREDNLTTGGLEMKLPTIIKKEGSRWVGCNLDYERVTDKYPTKKELMEEVGASGSKGIGEAEDGKVYAVFYDHETLRDKQGI